MALIPNFQTLYSDARAFLEGDPTYAFTDFSAGSFLDAFCALAAIEVQALMRWTRARFLGSFVSSAEGDDLDFVVFDRYGLTRLPEELGDDAAFRARVLVFVANLARATRGALTYYAETVEGVASATVVEDFETGIATIRLTLDAGADAETTTALVRAGLDGWRSAGRPVNVEVI